MALSSGDFVVIGVVVGGLVTGGVNYANAARNAWLDTRVARRRVRNELQSIFIAATFITLNDDVMKLLAESEKKDEYGSRLRATRDALLVSAMWQKHGDQLARSLSDDDWNCVEHAYESAGALANTTFYSDIPSFADETTRAVYTARRRLEAQLHVIRRRNQLRPRSHEPSK